VTPDGIILTNYHVVGACQPSEHLMGCSGDPFARPDGLPAEIFVGVSDASQSSSQQRYIAQVIRTLPEADLALVQIVTDLEGRPPQLPVPFAPLAVGPGAVELGEPVHAIGYPSIASAGGRISLTVTQGIVTGFTDDHGHRALINIDANIAHGNSGGALIDAEGRLVGVPSNNVFDPQAGERQNFARPLTLMPQSWVDLLREHAADIQL
jgi:S1-C subfamily serine protease